MPYKVHKKDEEKVIMTNSEKDCEQCKKYRDEIIKLKEEIIRLTKKQNKNTILKILERQNKVCDYIS